MIAILNFALKSCIPGDFDRLRDALYLRKYCRFQKKCNDLRIHYRREGRICSCIQGKQHLNFLVLIRRSFLGATSIEKFPSSKLGPTDENVGISYLIVIIKFSFFEILTPPPYFTRKPNLTDFYN